MADKYENGAQSLEYLEGEYAEEETFGMMPQDASFDEDEGVVDQVVDESEDPTNDMQAASEEADGERYVESAMYGDPPMTGELEPVEGYDASLLTVERGEAYAQVDESNLLDAWYAQFPDPIAAAAAAQARASDLTAEVVIGVDDRVRITSTEAIPWRWICSLLITARDGSRWIGTGWLAGPRLVVTAGHVVYMKDHGGWARSIEVIPGRNGAARPFGSVSSTVFRSVYGWTRSNLRTHDYGAIVLPASHRYGSRLGYFGFANLSDPSLLNLMVNLSGYPGDKPVGTQWWHARRINAVTPRTFVYNIDTAGGQSGSPVWRLSNGVRQAVGIHTNGSLSGNSATRIVQPVYNNLQAWKAAFP